MVILYFKEEKNMMLNIPLSNKIVQVSWAIRLSIW